MQAVRQADRLSTPKYWLSKLQIPILFFFFYTYPFTPLPSLPRDPLEVDTEKIFTILRRGPAAQLWSPLNDLGYCPLILSIQAQFKEDLSSRSSHPP